MCIKLLSNNKGLTLLEVLLGFAILTIVITSFLALFPQAAKFNQKTDESFTAINLGREKLAIIEQIAKKSSRETNPDNKLFTSSNNQFNIKNLSRAHTDFSRLNLTEDIVSLPTHYLLNTNDGNLTSKITIEKASDTEHHSVIQLYRITVEVSNSLGQNTVIYGYASIPK